MKIKAICFIFLPFILFLVLSCGSSSGNRTLGGYVLLDDETPVADIEITFIWPSWLGDWESIEVTDETGWYSLEVEGQFYENSVTITPYHPDYSFTPEEYHLNNLYNISENLELDFIAIPK